MPIARVVGGVLDADKLAAVDDWAAGSGVKCLYFLAAADDPATARTAEDGGFRLMDVRVELRRPAEPLAVDGIRAATDDDTEALAAIARDSHDATRFYADPNFDDDRCDELYDVWIRRSLGGWADGVLAADAGGRPAGYVSCHLDTETATGSIGLIAVDAVARGAGLGVELARAAVGWCESRGAREVSVVTQGRNVPALRTFGRAGFVVADVALWFHKWYV